MHSLSATETVASGECSIYRNHKMVSLIRRCGIAFALFPLALPAVCAQNTLEDYQRAERFLPGNMRHLVYVADVTPHWIEKTNRF